ncbi:uncharacterized protein LOC126264979 [Aethina tumida]|uniref:uncharacterized protein LOC126264979 n=1 Tax=Aethina tumida TaxID=116153 RepID=UPI0021476B8D|nr:uncharacterized protein LOC126264979 [Aethina tumida]
MLQLLLLCFVFGFSGASTPDFIDPCSLEDSSCLSASATKTLHNLLNGKKEYNVPKLNPVNLPLVELQGPGLSLSLKNIDVYGLPDAKITSVKFNTKEKTGEVVLHVPNAQIIGEYHLKGKISVLTLDGQGKGNITALGGDYTWIISYDYETKNGKEYLKVTKDDTKYDLKKVLFKFDDLFKGDKALSDSTNDVLNQEWRAVIDELGVGIAKTLGSVYKLVATGLFSKIPLNEITKS